MKINKLLTAPLFVFDVESRGLYGEGFAVGGGVYIGGEAQQEFRYSCPVSAALGGSEDDLTWVNSNVPEFTISHRSPLALRQDFWKLWKTMQKNYPELQTFGECIFPVESLFFAQCVKDNEHERKYEAPYPLYDITPILLCAGMDPMKTYERLPSELPKHDPLTDARQSVRLLMSALEILS